MQATRKAVPRVAYPRGGRRPKAPAPTLYRAAPILRQLYLYRQRLEPALPHALRGPALFIDAELSQIPISDGRKAGAGSSPRRALRDNGAKTTIFVIPSRSAFQARGGRLRRRRGLSELPARADAAGCLDQRQLYRSSSIAAPPERLEIIVAPARVGCQGRVPPGLA